MNLNPRHDREAERAVIGAVLLDASECWPAASEVLRGSDFHDPKHAVIWRAFDALMQASSAIDLVLLHSELLTTGKLEAAGGDEYLLGLNDTIPTPENTTLMAKRVRELSLVREVQRVAWRLAGEASEPIADIADYLDRAASSLAHVCEQRRSGLDVTYIADALSDSYTKLAQRQVSGETLLGHSTGIDDLDHAIGGLAAGDLIVLAGRPGTGKSALANMIKLGVARATGKPVLSLELEMSLEQFSHRVFSSESGVNLRLIRAATLGSHDLGCIARAADHVSRLPIAILVHRDTRISELRTVARRIARQQGPLSLIVVDYLQIARAERHENNREREIASITSALKSLAGEMHCPVLALSQLNRGVESRTGSDRRPRLSDLRESGAIEQDADTVLFIHREEIYDRNTPDKGIAEIIVGKQRSGPTGTIRLRWVKELTRFEALQGQQQQSEFAYEQANGRSGTGTNGHYHHEHEGT